MGERKVQNKYYPPDFDPAKLRTASCPKNQQIKVRMMLPMSIRCSLCGNIIYEGTKFNPRMEDVIGEMYLGIQVFRFYFKCTKCSAEITMKTDPQNSDYVVESGATRNFEPWREKDEEADKEKRKREQEEMGDAMKSLENNTMDSKREMDILAALDEMKSMKSKHANVSIDAIPEALQRTSADKMSLVEDSPVHSSSSDDFATILAAELASDSADSSSDEKPEDGDDIAGNDSKRMKMCMVEEVDKSDELQSSVSTEFSERSLDISVNEVCPHPGSFGNMCIRCGERLPEESGVTFGYIHRGLRFSNDEIDRLRTADMKNLLRLKKLNLILDLDHTLLNSTPLMLLTQEEEYLKTRVDSLQDVSKGSLFVLPHMHTMTKLRPFVRTFLKEASMMFVMYIYTMGDRPYALEMAKLLDPEKEYFNARVISRDDGTQRHQKGLDVILGKDSAVLILDDTEHAWTKHKDNLILMERYHYFASSCQQFGFTSKSLSQLECDESESDGALVTVIDILKQIHTLFFAELAAEPRDRDVRQVLRSVRKEILRGCRLVFSRVFPTKFQADSHHLWRMAEQLGAACSVDIEPSVTHVVGLDGGTEKCRWAVKGKKFLVNPQWIEASYYRWKRQPEEKYSVYQSGNT